ncbi:MAG: acyltransferase, partial [Proteobacteria bacterium]|nr:acyltransferase [Pseudomonadota bacterium]
RTDVSSQMPRLAYIDALRGFAALYVVVHHIRLMPKQPLVVSDWLKPLIGFGGSGVIMFFIISGFSMCLSWKRYAAAEPSIKNFYASRLARIAPLFYFWLIIAIVSDTVFNAATGQHGPIEIAANTLFLFNLYEPFQNGIVWASWTIGVEMLFYAVFPFIKRAGFTNLGKSSLLLVLSMIVVIMYRNTNGSGQPLLRAMFDGVGFFYVLPVFLLGVVTYHAHDLLNSDSNIILRICLRTVILPIGLVAIFLLGIYNPSGAIWYYASSVSYAMLLLGFSAWSKPIIVSPLTCYLGRISYSLYLNHPPLVFILIPAYLAIYNLGLWSVMAFSICVILTIVILIPISHLTFRFIETPVMAWQKKRIRNDLEVTLINQAKTP